MKILQTTVASVILATLSLSSIAQATDYPAFRFFGCLDSIPVMPGGAFKMVGFLSASVPMVPFDWDGKEHTIVIEATYDNFVAPFRDNYTNATVQIYTDVGPLSAGDYADQSTFSDFALVLSGVITNFLRVNFPGSSSVFNGSVDWTGGLRLAELGNNTTLYQLGAVGNTARPFPPDYEDCWWEGRIEPFDLAVKEQAWGQVKALFN